MLWSSHGFTIFVGKMNKILVRYTHRNNSMFKCLFDVQVVKVGYQINTRALYGLAAPKCKLIDVHELINKSNECQPHLSSGYNRIFKKIIVLGLIYAN